MTIENPRELGHRIVAARETIGWNQAELAQRTGFTGNTVRKVERGIKVAPATLRKILETVGLEPAVAAYPPDVEMARDVIGMHLAAIPAEERAHVVYELTELLMKHRH